MENSILKGKALNGDTSFLKLPKSKFEAPHREEPKKEEKKEEDFDLSLYRDMVESDKGLVEYIIQRRKRLLQEFNHQEMRIKELEKKKKEIRNKQQGLHGDEDKLSSEINKIKSEEAQLTEQLKKDEQKLGQDFNMTVQELNKKEEQPVPNNKVQTQYESRQQPSGNNMSVQELNKKEGRPAKPQQEINAKVQAENTQTGGEKSTPEGKNMQNNNSVKIPPEAGENNPQVAGQPKLPDEEDKQIKERLEQRYEELIKEIRNNKPKVSNEEVLNKVNNTQENLQEKLNSVEGQVNEEREYTAKVDEKLNTNQKWLQSKLNDIEGEIKENNEKNSQLKQDLNNNREELSQAIKETQQTVSNNEILDYIKSHRGWVEQKLGELEGELQEEKNRSMNIQEQLNEQKNTQQASEPKEQKATQKQPKSAKTDDKSKKQKTEEGIQDLLRKIDDHQSDQELKLNPDKLTDDEKKEHIYKMINEAMSCIGEEKYEKAQQLLKEITNFYNSLEGHVVDKHRIYEEVAEIKRFINSKTKK